MGLLDYPQAPKNVHVTPTYRIDAFDVRWDDPLYITENAQNWDIIGHRVYRSDESPTKGFQLVSGPTAIYSRAFRDRTKIKKVIKEDVSARFISIGDNERKEWIFKVRNFPIVVQGSQFDDSEIIKEVLVEVPNGQGGTLEVKVEKVRGDVGEITLISRPYLNLETNQIVQPTLPDMTPPLSGKCFCTYSYGESLVQAAYNRAYYYRVTTVARRKDDPTKIVETPLDKTGNASSCYGSNVANTQQFDGKDFIWNRANELNNFLLEQAGERYLFFLRKRSGERCNCWDRTHGQPRNDCASCFGTGFVGGYEGPFEAIGSPFEGTKSMELSEIGLMVNISYQVSILDQFLLNPQDILIRQDNQRYVISDVTPVGPRGTIRVQTFTVNRLPESDYRHNINVHPTQTNLSGPLEVDPGDQPDILKPIVGDTVQSDEFEVKGKTIPFINLMQGR